MALLRRPIANTYLDTRAPLGPRKDHRLTSQVRGGQAISLTRLDGICHPHSKRAYISADRHRKPFIHAAVVRHDVLTRS